MSRLDEIKDEIVSGTKFPSWGEYWTILGMTNDYHKMQQLSDELAKRYATECCQASLEKCSENAIAYKSTIINDMWLVDTESITNPENIILL